MSKARQFYVYILRDPRPGKNSQPFYIGKGHGSRVHFHWRNAKNHINPLIKRVLNKIADAWLEPISQIDSHFTVEAAAFQREIELIAQYGRRDLSTGPLCNLTDGGEGATGCLAASEHMRKLNTTPGFSKRNAEKRFTNPEFAKAHTKRMQKLHADPTFATARDNRLRKLHADQELVKMHAERGREQLRKLNADQEFAKANIDRLRDRNANPEFAKANYERAKKRFTAPEFVKAQSERMRKLHANPEFAKAHAQRSRERMQKLNAKRRAAKAA
jgi:hypothetical protein